jgi:glutamyl-tRNA reductase
LHVSKHVRNLDASSGAQAEIEDLCMRFLTSSGRPLAERKILVVGAGDIGKGLVAALPDDVTACQWCYRTRKPRIPARLAGKVELVPMAGLPAALGKADTVLCAAGGDDYLITPGMAAALGAGTELIDLAMPRNVDPLVANEARSIRVVDLDGIKRWYHQNDAEFAALLASADAVIREHADSYEKLVGSFQSGEASP